MVPGAFTSTTLLGRAVASLRSWTWGMVSLPSRIGGGRGSKEEEGAVVSSGSSDVHPMVKFQQKGQSGSTRWPKTIGSATQNRHERLSSDDHEGYYGRAVDLADMGHVRVARGPNAGPGSGHVVGPYRGHVAVPSDTTILKTTEFEQHEEDQLEVDHTSTNPYHERQHPWIGH